MRLLMRVLCGFLCVSAVAVAAPPQHTGDGGRFIVRAPKVTSAALRDEAREMQEAGPLQEMASVLNELFVLPRDVGMRYLECGEPNAFYDTEAHEIQICLELMEDIAKTLTEQYEEDSVADAVAGAYIATVLHEAGHALVDVLELPVTGREEDAVDQLSAWMLIQADDVDSVLGVASTYYNEIEVADEDFGNEHSLDRQRYFNLVCWAYGSDPGNSQELIDDWELPEARAEQCAGEYALIDRSWRRLLRDHLRDGWDTSERDDFQKPTVPMPEHRGLSTAKPRRKDPSNQARESQGLFHREGR